MKYFYLIFLTFFTATHIKAAGRESPVDEGLAFGFSSAGTKKTIKSVRRSATPSEAGSFMGSYSGSQGGASTIIDRHRVYTPTEISSRDQLIVEYGKLMESYQQLLQIASATDARLIQFVGVVDNVLPRGIDRASADEDSLASLQTGFRQLSNMCRVLKKSYNEATGKTTILESTVTELQSAQDELKETMAKMAPRPTEFVGTAMSPERVFATRETEADSSDVVKNLRAQVAELNAEISALNAAATSAADAATAEKDRLVAEIAALNAAATSAENAATAEKDRLVVEISELKKAMKPSTTGASKGVKEPLLGDNNSSSRDGRYTRLNDGEAASQGKGGNGCPCSVM